jgi:hypothetical protein
MALKQELKSVMMETQSMETGALMIAPLLKLPGSAQEDQQQLKTPALSVPLAGIKMMPLTLTPA